MFLMITKNPSYSFSCITPYICVFCRNEENKMKSKQFGQENEKVMHGRTHDCDHTCVVATTEQKKMKKIVFNKVSAWSRPQKTEE